MVAAILRSSDILEDVDWLLMLPQDQLPDAENACWRQERLGLMIICDGAWCHV